MASLPDLPAELQIKIISYLDFESLALLRATCTTLRYATSRKHQRHLLREYEHTSNKSALEPFKSNTGITFQDLQPCYKCLTLRPMTHFAERDWSFISASSRLCIDCLSGIDRRAPQIAYLSRTRLSTAVYKVLRLNFSKVHCWECLRNAWHRGPLDRKMVWLRMCKACYKDWVSAKEFRGYIYDDEQPDVISEMFEDGLKVLQMQHQERCGPWARGIRL